MAKENEIITTHGTTTPATTPAAAPKEKGARILTAIRAKFKHAALAVTTLYAMSIITAVSAFADGTGGAGADVDPDATFNKVISFFANWIGRIGLVVAFVGGIMFGLAFKNEDADGKTRGLQTLAAGFIVFALSKSLNLFGIETAVI